MDWDDEWLTDGGWDWTTNYYDSPKDTTCKHEWYAIELISSTVYNCKHCDIKKEEWEKNK